MCVISINVDANTVFKIISNQIREEPGEGHYMNLNIILKNIVICDAEINIKIKQHWNTALTRD